MLLSQAQDILTKVLLEVYLALNHSPMPPVRLYLLGVAICALTGCDSPIRQRDSQQSMARLALTYRIQGQESVVDWPHGPGWPRRWPDSLVAQLERGVLPALDQDNRPLPADSLSRARRLRGVVLVQDGNGILQEGTLYHPAGELRGYVAKGVARPSLDLYFYDQAVSLEIFYARVPVSVLETITGRPVALVPAK